MRDLAAELFNAVKNGLPESACEVEYQGDIFNAVCGGVTLNAEGSDFGLSLGPSSFVRLPESRAPAVPVGGVITLHYRGERAQCRIVSAANIGGIIRLTVEATYARA